MAQMAWDELGSNRAIDVAQSQYRDWWLHHAILGDPSWDSFEREPGNPIYTGSAPHEWPVNGFLFRDPVSGCWFAYVSLYPKGYWPPGGVLALREVDGQWQPAGLVLEPSADSFEGDGQRCGGAVDVSLVYEAGCYHMVYGWCDPDNQRGGLAYAWGESPTGPFHRAPAPLHEDTYQTPILGRYVRAYASTLVRRERDWMILHMMSTPRNAGGTWALACMTSPHAEGPYSQPNLLVMPQSDRFHPPLAEFYPQFVHDGAVYAPATSVALNRSFQVLYRAPIEQAHMPDAWEISQYGSLWHAEPTPAERSGIWGQTFSAQVAPDGWMRAFYPCKTRDDRGTIHIARRRWDEPYRDGFTLSAPNGPALAILKPCVGDFRATITARSSGPWAVCWQCRAPLGPDHEFADASLHRLTRTQRCELRRGPVSQVIRLDDQRRPRLTETLAADWSSERTEHIELVQSGGVARITLNANVMWQGELGEGQGRIELLAEAGTVVRVDRFELEANPESDRQYWLSTESLAGAAEEPGAWLAVEDAGFRFGVGHVSARANARAKWCVVGSRIRLYSPRGPAYGRCDVCVDGQWQEALDFHALNRQNSSVVRSYDLPHGPHVLVIRSQSAGVPCDVIEVESM